VATSDDKAPSWRDARASVRSSTGDRLNTTGSVSAPTPDHALVDEPARFGATNPALLALLRRLRLLARETEGTYVTLQRGQVVFDRHEICHHAYFPLTARFAYECVLNDGRSVELTTAGDDAFVGWPLLTGADSMPFRTTVSVSGTAFCCTASALGACLQAEPELETRLLDCVRGLLAELSQRAACIKLHTVDQQIACRLLTLHDQSADAAPMVSISSVARALGVTDRSVRAVLRDLADEGIVATHHGTVSTLDRSRLEARSCECYRLLRAFYRTSGES
jgi:CRP-like cAMP-binding protein